MLTLKDFKDRINNNKMSTNINISNIGGNDSQTYGILLDGIDHLLRSSQYKNISLKNLNKDKGWVSITIEPIGSDSTAKTLIDNMVVSYQKNNKASKSGNVLKMTEAQDEKENQLQGDEGQRQKIADNLWKKTIPFTSSSLSAIKPTLAAIAESDEINTDLILEDINRIKQIMING
jgi:hypothetical protein